MMRARWFWGLMVLALGCDSAAEAEPADPPEPAGPPAPSGEPSTMAASSPLTPEPLQASDVAPARPKSPPAGMVKIPAGIFLMGSTFSRGNPEERPMHEAIVAAFFMDEHEVTQKAYLACVDAGACAKPHRDAAFCNTKYDDRDDHPVNCVDLKMAAAYCAHVGKRLPSEREWEYAAGGGSEHSAYSWGNSPEPSPKNNCYNHPGGSCPVKSFEPGAFGLYDMTGNVWEWTQSAFDPYPSQPGIDPIEDGRLYAYRGGSWSRRFAKWMRTPLRNRYKPGEYSAALGMRCVQSIEPLECPPETAAKDGACLRTSGTPRCEEEFVVDGQSCVPDPKGKAAHLAGRWPPAENPANFNRSAALPGAALAEDAPSISRSRTPQHDADCQKNWPATPASYLFQGGSNYPSRKPALRAAGCVPRDMNAAWTSACCPG